jgi:hypothetical protein
MLGPLADASEDHLAADAAPGRVAPEALGDLRGELARRGQHQRADRPAATRGLDAQQLVEDGKGEGCGLAGAGLGAGEQVAGLQGVGDGVSLNRGRLCVSEGLEDGDQLGVEIQRLEAARGALASFWVRCSCRQKVSCRRRVREAVSLRFALGAAGSPSEPCAHVGSFETNTGPTCRLR